jgi:hypothetical protein
MSNFQVNATPSPILSVEAEIDVLRLLVADLYYSAHRDGWEPSESVSEVCDRAHDYLCNAGLDPYTNGGPENIAALRKRAPQPKNGMQEGDIDAANWVIKQGVEG